MGAGQVGGSEEERSGEETLGGWGMTGGNEVCNMRVFRFVTPGFQSPSFLTFKHNTLEDSDSARDS